MTGLFRTLEKIPCGLPFTMMNYSGAFIRVETDGEVQTIKAARLANPLPFNDEGFHMPVVELGTGRLFWMHKSKPCAILWSNQGEEES